MTLDWLDAFLITGLFQVVMVTGLALLLHLQLGLTRIANFGVVGFWGIGMYVFGVLYVQVDWPFGDPWQFLACAAAATLVSGLAGLLVGWLVSDLDTDGVLVGTLGFATAVQILATTQDDITGGARGMGGLAFPYDIGKVKEDEFLWLVITAVVVVAILFFVWRVHRSPYGRLLIAVGGNEPLARSLGKSTFRTKLGLFAITSAGMGLLGAMNGVMVRYPRYRQPRDRHHPRRDGGPDPGRHGARLGSGRRGDPHRGPVRHRDPVLRAIPEGVVHAGDPRAQGGRVRPDADPRADVPAAGPARRHAARQADGEDPWSLTSSTPWP